MKVTTITGNSTDKVENAIWLQGIGQVAGKLGSEIEEGDTLVWNYGHTSTVTAIVKETAKFVTVELEYLANQYTGEMARSNRRIGKDKIVGIAYN